MAGIITNIKKRKALFFVLLSVLVVFAALYVFFVPSNNQVIRYTSSDIALEPKYSMSMVTRGSLLINTINNKNTSISLYAIIDNETIQIDGYTKPFMKKIKNEDYKWGFNISVPAGAAGNNFVNKVQYVIINISSTHELEQYGNGFKYYVNSTVSGLYETKKYVVYNFDDLSLYFNLSVIYGKYNVMILLDPQSLSLAAGKTIVLDPTITLTDVTAYGGDKVNITCESHPYCHSSINDASMMLYLPFDTINTSSGITYDYTSNNNDGTIFKASYNESGIHNGSYEFNGLTSGIHFLDSSTLEPNNISISLWIKPYSWTGSSSPILSKRSATTTGYYLFYYNLNSALALDWGGSTKRWITGLNPALNTWTHVVLIRNETGRFIYRNGAFYNSTSDKGGTSVDTTAWLRLGNDTVGTVYYNGSMDEVYIFNRSLTLTEISDLYYMKLNKFNTPSIHTFNTTNISQSGNENRINVTTNTTQINGTSIQLRLLGYNSAGANIENTTWESVVEGNNKITQFNISTTVYNVSLQFNYSSNSLYSYSPLLRDNIILNTWQSGSTPLTGSPNVTNLVEYPTDPATYSPLTIYHFNATIVDDGGIQAVRFEFNNVNYTPSSSGSVYTASIRNISAGSYSYRWYVNDTSGYVNNSEVGTYTINKATPSLSLSGTSPITYGTTTDFSGSGCPTQLTCSLNITNKVYGAGSISANYSTAGNTNYTSNYTTLTIIINRAAGIIYTYIDNSRANKNLNNGSVVLFNTTLVTGNGIINLTIANVLWNTGTVSLYNTSQFNSSGSYSVNGSYPGNENYTSASERWTLTITNTTNGGGTVTTSTTENCKYKKFGYYNIKLPWMKEINCV